MAISTNGTIITRLAGSLYGEYLSNASYTELNTTAAATVAANMLSNDFAGKTDAQIATTVLTNLSLTTIAGLDNWVAAQLTAAGSTAAAKGAKLVSMLNDYAMMTADATYGASATSFNTKVAASLVLSQTTGNAGGTFATAGTAPVSGGSFTLTAGTDIAGATSSSVAGITNSFRFTSGSETIEAMTASMQAADTLLDSAATGDTDVINILATGAMNALTAVNIETANVNLASGTPTAVLTNFSGLDNVNITGNVAGTVTDAEAAMISLNNYTRVLTINETLIDGTTALANADVTNITVSGLSHGLTTATRSGVTLTAGTDGVLETLNITSAGTAANDFTLNAHTNVTLSTVNVLGSTAVTVRVANADLTGLTFNATTAGDVSLVVDRTGLTTTSTNANIWTGVDDLVLVDSDTPAVGGDGGSVSGLKVGQKVTFGNDFNASVLAFSNATGSTDTATIVLDNTTALTDTDVAQINAQSVETLVITSNGFASSTSSTAENLIDDLVGDATTITVNGDTSVELDLNIDAASSGTRTVVVNASANTAFVNIEAAAGAGATSTITVAYNITGTAGNDTLSLNGIGGTLSGGDGNDTLTGGALNDTISTGAGTDTVFATTGTDTVTFGTGVDTIIFGEADVTAVAQTTTLQPAGLDIGTVSVNVNGITYNQVFVTGPDETAAAFVVQHAAAILANAGVTVTAVVDAADDILKFVGASTGTAFTASATYFDSTVAEAAAIVTTAGVAGVSVATTIVDFTTAAGGDVISLDISEMNGVTGIDTVRDSTDDVAGGDAVELTAYAGAAVTMAAGANVIKVTFANTINSAADVLTLIDAANITVAGAVSSTDKIVITYYDADAGSMIVGLLQSADAVTALDDNMSINEIAIVGMTSAQYTALTAANFSFVL
jgi:hypothetical protein